MTEKEFSPFELFGSLVYVSTAKSTGPGKGVRMWPARVECLDLRRGQKNKHSDPRLNRKNYFPVTYFGSKNEIGWVHEDRITLSLLHYNTMKDDYDTPVTSDAFFELRNNRPMIKRGLELTLSATLICALREMQNTPFLGAVDRKHGNDMSQISEAYETDLNYANGFIDAIMDGTKVPVAPNKAQLVKWDKLFPSP